jgi:hypothetical protein
MELLSPLRAVELVEARMEEVGEVAGRLILLDRRIMARMPSTIPITVGGIVSFRPPPGILRREWARLLYS